MTTEGATLNIVLVGAESAAIQVLDGLASSGHRIAGVLADEPRVSVGEGLAGAAARLDLEVIDASRVKDPAFAGWLREREVDLLLNVHSLSIASDEVVSAPRIGSFNLHPGPLPAYAGLNVFCWAVYNGEPRHGVTLHWMDAGVDTGLVAYSADFEVTERDTGLSVFGRCVREGVPLVFSLLEQAARDPAGIPRRPQVGTRMFYRRRDVPQGGMIEWDRPARRIHDFVRACDFGPFPSPWGHPQALLGEQRLGISGTALTGEACTVRPGTVGVARDRVVLVATADEWIAVRGTVVEGRSAPPAQVLQPGRVLAPPG